MDFTGSLTNRGQSYGQAIIDASNWTNETGGINGRLIDLDSVETACLVRRAINAYRFADSSVLYTMLIINLRYPNYLPEEAINSVHVSCSGTRLSHYSREHSFR